MTNRCLCVGFVLFLAGGCANQPITKHSNSAMAAAKNQPVIVTTQPNDTVQTKFIEPGTPADLLRRQTEAYAKPFSTDAADAVNSDRKTDASPIRSADPMQRNARKDHKDRGDHADAVDASPIGQPASVMLSPNLPASEVKTPATVEGPKIMPESADFITGESADKDALGVRLRRRLRNNPRDIVAQLDLQLYGMLNDDPAPDLASVTELPSDDREIVSALIDGISNFRSAVREDSNMLTAKKIQSLLEMAERLRSQADLTVSTVALCRKVDGFGKYEPITPSRFGAGKENPAIVYCEVDNFMPKQEGAVWKTRLSEQVTLYTDTGMLAWSDDRRDVTDECRNRRHDFFAYNIIHLPASLTVGRYMLKVSIEDKNSDRVAESTVPLEIVGK